MGIPSAKQIEAAKLYDDLRSYARVATILGIDASTVRQRIDGYRAHVAKGHAADPKLPITVPEGFVLAENNAQFDGSGRLKGQSIKTRLGVTEPAEVPENLKVKGLSVLSDAHGNVRNTWTLYREDGERDLIPYLQEAFATYGGLAPVIPAPAETCADRITFYPLPDLHFGLFSWGKETGSRYDVKIATETALHAVSELVHRSDPTETAILLGLGDYFHANDHKAATPASGNRLDVDGRWPKVYAAGAQVATQIIDILARKHQRVLGRFLPGNHDTDAAPTLSVALKLFYSQTPRIEIDLSPSLFWYHRFGSVLLGATHGHTMKPRDMAMAMAADRREDWGASKYRHFFFGHVHHESAEEIAGVRVESFQAVCAPDAYSAGSFRAGRSLNSVTFDRMRGEVCRSRVNIVS